MVRISIFVIAHSSLIRHSGFVIRIFAHKKSRDRCLMHRPRRLQNPSRSETFSRRSPRGQQANQKAHEVSRDLTAWALPGIGPMLLASVLPARARLGPLGTKSQGTASTY